MEKRDATHPPRRLEARRGGAGTGTGTGGTVTGPRPARRVTARVVVAAVLLAAAATVGWTLYPATGPGEPTSAPPSAPGNASPSARAPSVSPVPRSTPPTVVVPDVRFATVAYGPHPRQLLDVHLPPGPGPHPVLLWVHGGGWSSGARTDDTAVWERYAAEYAVVSVDYRLAPETTWPAQGDDVAAAIDWVRGPAARAVGLDGDRLVVAGWSAGGHLATWAGVTSGPGVVDGVVSLSGALILEPAGAYGSFVDEAAAEMLGEQPAAAADPGLIAGDGAPPVFLQQGRLDRTVPPDISETAARRLRAAGVAVRTETVERDHPYTLTPAVDAFVAEHLGEPATGPTPGPVVAAGETDAAAVLSAIGDDAHEPARSENHG